MRPLTFFAAVLLSAGILAAQTVDERIAAEAASSPVAKGSVWGVHAINLATSKVLYTHNANLQFLPASNAKLFSTALALTRLGPGHTFLTRVMATTPPDGAGFVKGDLYLVGGGDTSLSGREVPYRRDSVSGNPLAPLEALADEVYRVGVRRISGDVVGDDTLYPYQPYPEGWVQDDTLWDYGAPVSALTLHDNSVAVEIRPSERAADPAYVRVIPSLGYFTVDSRVVTEALDAEPNVRFNRSPGSRTLRLTGKISRVRGPTTIHIAVDDPARYAAFALRDALTRRGVIIDGGYLARHRYPGTPMPKESPAIFELAERVSPPLIDLLKITNKISQNLHAEMILLAANRGLREDLPVANLFSQAGLPEPKADLRDASGLSRLTIATPASLVQLLEAMAASQYAAQWLDLLPIGGEDGTLSARFRGFTQGRIIAKTGTETHVSALAGYLDNHRGQRIAFSIIVNNANARASAMRDFIDRIVVLLAE